MPYQFGPGGPVSHLPSQLGGARPKKLQQQNLQVTNKQMAASLRRGGLTKRIVSVRLKKEEEQEEMSATGKGGVAIGIFTIMFFILFLILPYSHFSPWD
jgi:hypothetical protein